MEIIAIANNNSKYSRSNLTSVWGSRMTWRLHIAPKTGFNSMPGEKVGYGDS